MSATAELFVVTKRQADLHDATGLSVEIACIPYIRCGLKKKKTTQNNLSQSLYAELKQLLCFFLKMWNIIILNV